MKAVFDTNILIDYLNGIEAAKEELERFSKPAISLITWMEVLIGAKTREEEQTLRHFLERFETVELSDLVAEEAVRIRREHRLKLPDAIVWATATAQDALLVTRNTKDFPNSEPSVRVPYQL